MRKLRKSITETNCWTSKKMTSSVTLLHCLKNTHFLYYKWISFIFSLKYFEEKYLTRLLLCIFCLQYGTLFPPKVDIYFHDDRSRFCYERLRFSWWQAEIFLWTVGISMMTGRYFIMSDWNFHDDRSRFYYEWLKFSRWQVQIVLWTVEIFTMADRVCIMNDWDFHDDRSRLFYERLRFSWWQVEILLWTIEIFMMTGRNFIMNDWDFHDDRSKFSWSPSL